MRLSFFYHTQRLEVYSMYTSVCTSTSYKGLPIADTTACLADWNTKLASTWKNDSKNKKGRRVVLHRKKKVREFPVPSRDVTTNLSLGGNNDVITELFLPRAGGVWLVTSRQETGNSWTFFYGVCCIVMMWYWTSNGLKKKEIFCGDIGPVLYNSHTSMCRSTVIS